ncbi:M28 family peptidase [Planctomicrobium sp. SH661]|uniref:M28 family peptidase n=1 Tax=Planctomicrobium sp. SH661 TaxID=3448124 RepID=UPI003F5B07F7
MQPENSSGAEILLPRKCSRGLGLPLMRLVNVVLTAAIVFSISGALSAQEIPPRAEARVRAHISYLASPELRGRSGRAKAAARDYIVREFHQNGVEPFFDGQWVQPIPGQTSFTGEPGPPGENIGGCVRGTDPILRDEWIVINAHYDHLGVRNGQTYPGADDNASGVAMLLEVSKQIASAPLKRSVAFVAFDFEESLLWGSRWFIGHTPVEIEQIKFCITADMIGRSLGGLGLPTVFVMGAEHSSVIRSALNSSPERPGLEVAQLGADMIGTRSDYGPFRDQQIPFLFFSTGEHPNYHTPEDTPDRIDYPKATRIIELITGLVQILGNTSDELKWEAPEYQKLEEAKAVLRVTEQLIDAENDGRIKLSATQRFFVTQVKSKTGYMVRKQKVSDDERKWVARTAQLLLLSVF